MNPFRKADSFPQLGVPGDPRLLNSINLRTPKVAGGGITHVPGGIIITPKKSRGGGASSPIGPLSVTTNRPAFIQAPGSDVADGSARVWVTYGTVNSKIATNLKSYFDISEAKTIYAKATFTTSGAFAVSKWEISVEADDFEIPIPSGARPSLGYYALGSTFVLDGAVIVVSAGSGSLNVWPQISNSITGSVADSVIVWSRQ